MILRLARVPDLPLRQQNALLLAAGFAPAWRESELSAPELAEANSSIEPFPAFVVDRRWTLLRANPAAVRLTEFLVGLTAEATEPVNLAVALLSPDVYAPTSRLAGGRRHFLRSVQADAIADGTPETAELLRRLLAFPGARRSLTCRGTTSGGHP